MVNFNGIGQNQFAFQPQYQQQYGNVVNNYIQGADPTQLMMLLQLLQNPQLLSGLNQYAGGGRQMPPSCHMPPPGPKMSGAPAGQGLKKMAAGNADGFPANTVETAGGYKVVATGRDQEYKIYAPGQKFTDTPHTRIWGDPHVVEKDGTTWEHSTSDDLLLGDGTRIGITTTSQTTGSVTKDLDIQNGADHIKISDVNTGNPTVGSIQNDGYEWRADHIAENPHRTVFQMGGTKDDVKWFKVVDGENLGLITGSEVKDGAYTQKTKAENYYIARELRPQTGSVAEGHKMRSEMADQIGNSDYPENVKDRLLKALKDDHAEGEFYQTPGSYFGGCGSFNHSALTGMGDAWFQQQLLSMMASGNQFNVPRYC